MYTIKKNAQNEFFTIDGITAEIFFREDDFIEPDSTICGVTKQSTAACIWPFCDSYARVLGKNGNWGYISENDLSIKWLDNKVLYADDFSCGLARIQFVDKSYNFIDEHMRWLSQSNFEYASLFENGIAVVSDTICKHYQIDTKGNVTERDQRRYRIAIEYAKILRDEEVRKERKRSESKRINNSIYDPETEIMKSLSGKGADPEFFGY